MNFYQELLELNNLMAASPVKNGSQDQLPIKKDELFFDEEIQALNTLIKNVHSALKVAIVGEVKAGKSTLINSLAGKVISPANFLEATACIIEIMYAPYESARIIFKDGTEICKEKIEEVFKILEEHQNDQEFFGTCQSVEIQLPLEGLTNLTLADTPGLETITQENTQRTEEYLANVDVILFVINANYLGQSDINDRLIEVSRLGKPVIALLNRVDEVDGDVDRLVNYLDDEIGIYVEKIIPVSAYQALEAVLNSDEANKSKSGYLDVMDYLITQINDKVDQVKLKSSLQTAQNLLHRDKIKHEKVLKLINNLKEQLDKSVEMVRDYSNKTSNYAVHLFEMWYNHEFLEIERAELQHKINSSKIIGHKKEIQKINKDVIQLLSMEHVEQLISRKIKEIDSLFLLEWDKALNKLKEEVLLDLENFSNQEQESLVIQLNQSTKEMQFEGGILSGASAGAFVGGAAGISAAFYAAALGPAASYVTIGMAAASLVPPFLIVGGTIGLANKFIKFKNDKNEAANNVAEVIRNFKNENKLLVYKYVVELFNERSKAITTNLVNELTNAFYNKNNSAGLDNFKNTVEEYVDRSISKESNLFVITSSL